MSFVGFLWMNNSLKTLKYLSQTYLLSVSEHQGHFDMFFPKTEAFKSDCIYYWSFSFITRDA